MIATPPVKRHDRVADLIRQMQVVEIASDDETLLSLLLWYRKRFGMDASVDVAQHAEKRWKAMKYAGRIVAVFGEVQRLGGRALEVTDGYCEISRFGYIAFFAMALAYKGMIDSGRHEWLFFTTLYGNERMWRAVIRETGTMPWALMFAYGKAAA